MRADDWDPQMLFFLRKVIGLSRPIGADMAVQSDRWRTRHGPLCRRSEGRHRSSQPEGCDSRRAFDRRRTGGALSWPSWRKRVAKAVIISAVPPLMVKTDDNPLGPPKSAFDDLQAQLAANRANFYHDMPAGPFYGFNRPGVKQWRLLFGTGGVRA